MQKVNYFLGLADIFDTIPDGLHRTRAYRIEANIGDEVRDVLLGGSTVYSSTLLRFYVLHVAVLPSVMVLVLMIHLWRWRKDSMMDPGAEDADDD